MKARVKQFREAVARYFGGRPGRGARYPEDLQQEAVVLARAGMLEGKSLGWVASELEVGCATLARWMEGAQETLRPVEVQREEELGGASSFVLVAPSGWRIEGLHREDLAELLRVLG